MNLRVFLFVCAAVLSGCNEPSAEHRFSEFVTETVPKSVSNYRVLDTGGFGSTSWWMSLDIDPKDLNEIIKSGSFKVTSDFRDFPDKNFDFFHLKDLLHRSGNGQVTFPEKPILVSYIRKQKTPDTVLTTELFVTEDSRHIIIHGFDE